MFTARLAVPQSQLKRLSCAIVCAPREVEGHDGIIYPVELGRQVELICRSHMVRAAISFFAEIECNFIFSSGNDTGLTRSAALMALIGAPGTGGWLHVLAACGSVIAC